MVLRNDRRGITGIVDAMIFIVIMSLVFSALYANSQHETEDCRAAEISGNLLSSKVRACDITDSEDSKMLPIADAMAIAVVTGNKNAVDMLTSVLDASVGVPGSYLFTMTYNGKTLSIGKESGIQTSGFECESVVTYGGILKTELRLD